MEYLNFYVNLCTEYIEMKYFSKKLKYCFKYLTFSVQCTDHHRAVIINLQWDQVFSGSCPTGESFDAGIV
jgi:hypothetical protein